MRCLEGHRVKANEGTETVDPARHRDEACVVLLECEGVKFGLFHEYRIASCTLAAVKMLPIDGDRDDASVVSARPDVQVVVPVPPYVTCVRA